MKYLKHWKEEKDKSKISNIRLSFITKEEKRLRQKLGEFTAKRLAEEEMLKEVLQEEGNDTHQKLSSI